MGETSSSEQEDHGNNWEDGWKSKVEDRLGRNLSSKPASLYFIVDDGEPLSVLGRAGDDNMKVVFYRH